MVTLQPSASKDKGAHPFVCGQRAGCFRAGAKASGITGVGGFIKALRADTRMLLVPVSHVVASGFLLQSMQTFLNSKFGLKCLREHGYVLHLGEGWLYVPWGYAWMQCPLGKWEDVLERHKKKKDFL